MPTSEDLLLCAKDLFVAAMNGKGPDHLRPGQVGRTARSRIRPFPLCIIALSRNASCLHLLFNYSQSAFFGQGPPRAVTLQGPTTTPRPICDTQPINIS